MDEQQQRFDELRLKYQPVLDLIQQSGVTLTSLQLQSNKLFVQGEAPSEQVGNTLCEEINASYSELLCDLTVNPPIPQPGEKVA
jgi:hypothetical protein